MVYEFENLQQFENDIKKYEYIYLAAAGCYGEITGRYLNNKNIDWEGYVDNNCLLHGKTLNGKKITSPDKIKKKEKSLIIICTIMCAEEIENQLCLLGIPQENIYLIKKRNIWELMTSMLDMTQEYMNRLKKLKGLGPKYHRCFVIGTGPSLTIKDLNMLKNEFTFSTNAIVNCFGMSTWRPTCYCVDDPAAKKIHVDEYGIERLAKECRYVICSMRSGMSQFADKYDNLFFYRSFDEYQEDGSPLFSEDVLANVYCGGTTLYGILQIALWMGFDEVYLLGVDLGFAIEKHLDGTIEKKEKNTARAEFLKRENDTKPIYEIEKILRGYRVVKEYAEEHGIMIKNATRGGKLDIFKRINLEDIIGNNE